MKALPGAFLLLFAAAAGAFVHHVATAQPATQRRAQIVGTRHSMPTGPSSAAMVRRTDELLACGYTEEHPVNWVQIGDHLSDLAVDEFPLIYRDLVRRGDEVRQRNQELVKALLEYWAAADADGLLAFAENGSAGLKLKDVVSYCILYRPDAVIAAILRGKPGRGEPSTDSLLQEVLGVLATHQPATALETAARHGILQRGELSLPLTGAVWKWIGQDAVAAIRFAEAHSALLPRALSAWMRKDPDAVQAWLAQRPEAARGWEGKAGALEEYIANHPDDAGRFRDQFSEGDFTTAVAAGMASKSVEEAAAWIHGLSPTGQSAGYASLIELLSWRAPAKAVELCERLPELATNPATGEAILALGARDPAAAIRWLQDGTLPDAVRDQALPEVVQSWLARDRAAATAFIERQPPSELTGRLLLDASRILTDGNGDSAREFALSLPHPALRLGACRRILDSELRHAGLQPNSSDPVQMKAVQARAAPWLSRIPDAALRRTLEMELAAPPPEPVPPPELDSPDDPFAEIR